MIDFGNVAYNSCFVRLTKKYMYVCDFRAHRTYKYLRDSSLNKELCEIEDAFSFTDANRVRFVLKAIERFDETGCWLDSDSE